MIGFEEEKARRNGYEIGIQVLSIHMHHQPFRNTPHYHDYIELLYQINGVADVFAGDRCYRLLPGSLLMLPGGTAHDLQSVTPRGRHIVIKFRPQLLFGSISSVLDLRDLLPFQMPGTRQLLFDKEQLQDGTVRRCVHTVLHEWIRQKRGFELAMRAEVLHICLWILRQWDRAQNQPPAPATERLADIQRVLEVASERYATLTAAEAAAVAHMSYSYFCRTFKQVMSVSFPAYLLSLRLAAAERILLADNRQITDIAELCGFAGSSHFIRLFKKEKGVSPHRYRQSALQQRSPHSQTPK